MPTLSRRNLLIGGGVALVAAGAGAWVALQPKVYEAAPVFSEDGLAIRGYDPVAYFRQGEPLEGDPAHAVEWRGAEWRFASAENREIFLEKPEAYAPAYGGFCAWAVAAKGELYSTQPDNWTIHDGRLFLNFNDDIQAKFEQDVPGFVAEADRRWPEILEKG